MSTSVTLAFQVIYILRVFAFVVLKKKKIPLNIYLTFSVFDYSVEVMNFNGIRAMECVLKRILDIKCVNSKMLPINAFFEMARHSIHMNYNHYVSLTSMDIISLIF